MSFYAYHLSFFRVVHTIQRYEVWLLNRIESSRTKPSQDETCACIHYQYIRLTNAEANDRERQDSTKKNECEREVRGLNLVSCLWLSTERGNTPILQIPDPNNACVLFHLSRSHSLGVKYVWPFPVFRIIRYFQFGIIK